MRDYITKQGDMVDLIAFEFYGNDNLSNLIYEANPGLANHELKLPAGLTIAIPDQPANREEPIETKGLLF